jgi:hypothetical protein
MKYTNFSWHWAGSGSIVSNGISVQQNLTCLIWRPRRILKYLALPVLALSSVQAATSVQLDAPAPQTVLSGQALAISASASDPDGNLREHWLEIKRPAGDWSWEGWLTGEPWGPALGGDTVSSSKSGSFTFTAPGAYVIRSTALSADGTWATSTEVTITVVNLLPAVTLTSPPTQTVIVGNTLTISSAAQDTDGNLREHWMEIKRPDGVWSWEGWLTGEPWTGTLSGDGFSSSKSGGFIFTEVGAYIIRASAVDASGNWQTSAEVTINVTAADGI